MPNALPDPWLRRGRASGARLVQGRRGVAALQLRDELVNLGAHLRAGRQAALGAEQRVQQLRLRAGGAAPGLESRAWARRCSPGSGEAQRRTFSSSTGTSSSSAAAGASSTCRSAGARPRVLPAGDRGAGTARCAHRSGGEGRQQGAVDQVAQHARRNVRLRGTLGR